jgi:hypothetical protein
MTIEQLTAEQKLQLKSSPCFHCKGTDLVVIKDQLTTDKTKSFYYVGCSEPECLIVGDAGDTPQEAIDLWIEENNSYLT